MLQRDDGTSVDGVAALNACRCLRGDVREHPADQSCRRLAEHAPVCIGGAVAPVEASDDRTAETNGSGFGPSSTTATEPGPTTEVRGSGLQLVERQQAQPELSRPAQPSLTPSVRRRSYAESSGSPGAAAPEEELGALRLSISCGLHLSTP